MEIVSPLILLALVALFVAFVARWRPGPGKIADPQPTLDEVPIAAPDGAPLIREAGDREAAMLQALRSSGIVPKRQWERVLPDLLLIHDDLSDAEIAGLLSGLGPVPVAPQDTVSSEEIVPVEGTASARERFRALLASRGLETEVEPLGTHFAPGPFEAYRRKRVPE